MGGKSRPCVFHNILNRNDQSEHIAHLDHIVQDIISCCEVLCSIRLPPQVGNDLSSGMADTVFFSVLNKVDFHRLCSRTI